MLTPEEEAHKARLLQEIEDMEERARVRQMEELKTIKYSFARVKDADILNELRRFQQTFGKYIPELIDDEHATIYLHSRMEGGIFRNPVETYDRHTFENDIKRFRKAIKTLAEFSIWGTKPCMVHSHWQCESSKNDDGDVKYAAMKVYECLLLILSLDDYYNTLPQVLDELEGWARHAAEALHDRRNINWQAVHAVDRLRGFWEGWTETPAPRRALNPTSPFADYLRDAFEFFEIPGDPCAAFKRWVALEDEDPDKWK